MSLKDRIRSKKEAKNLAGRTEYSISIEKVSKAVVNSKNSEDLGNIVREFAKFLNTLEPQNTKILFSGDFDMGQKTLLNCLLANFLEENSSDTTVKNNDEDVSETPKLIKKRKSLKSLMNEK